MAAGGTLLLNLSSAPRGSSRVGAAAGGGEGWGLGPSRSSGPSLCRAPGCC